MKEEASESLAAARRADARCDEFEQALATNKSPQIESFLSDLPASERQTLLLELLGLELDFRVARGEQPKVTDYAKRFPELSAEQLAALVEASRGRAGVIASVGSAVPNAEQPTILSPTDAVELASDESAAALRRVRYFGDYELLREIARGGMGVVYEARQRSLNRPVALKMILSGQLASVEEVARFRREAEAAAQLEHPGIVPIFEIGTDGDQHYFTMGYVSGPSLSARLLERPLEPREAATLIRDVALAVQYAHERGVVHRDLKPSNILLAPRSDSSHVRQNVGQTDVRPHSGECGYAPRITDFGLAKVSHADHSLTETGQILGTPSYMPPEQAAGLTHEIGPAADIYSLGAVLYACLTGRPPFQAASVLDTVRQVLERDPVSLRDLNVAIPQDLETICLKCLEKSIPRRYPTAKEVADELQRYLEGRPIEARPVSRRERAWRWCRRNPIVAGLSAAVALSLLLGIAVSSYFAWQENQRAIAESNARRDEEFQRRKADQQTVIAKKLGADNLKLAEDEKAARQKADLNADAAQQQTKLAKRHLYAAHMQQIQMAWDGSRVGQANRLLDLYRPAQGQAPDVEDLRSFEWYYWDRCCHSDLLTLNAHASGVLCVAFSPDGQRLASGGTGEASLKVWDLNTGLELMSLKGHRGYLFNNPGLARTYESLTQSGITTVHSVAYRHDGKQLASGGADGTVAIWDLTTGQNLMTLKGHSYQMKCVAFTPDGSRLASLAMDPMSPVTWEFKLWDAVTGEEIRSRRGSEGVSECNFAFSPDGKRIALTNTDLTGAVKLWDTATGDELPPLGGKPGYARKVAFSPDGQLLAATNLDSTIKVWHVAVGHELHSLKGHLGPITSVAFSPDGQRLASTSTDQTIKVWSVETGQELLTFKGHTEWTACVAFSPDGTRLASGGDRTIKFWNPFKNQEARALEPKIHFSQKVAYHSNGKQMAVVANYPPAINICDAATGNVLQTVRLGNGDPRSDGAIRRESIAFSPDGRQAAMAYQDNSVRVIEMATGRETHILKGHTALVESIAFHPDGTRLASGGINGIVKVWDTENGQETLSLSGHAGTVESLVYSSNGQWLASGSSDKTARTWEATTGRKKSTLTGHTSTVRCVAFSPDGKRLASASDDRSVKVWDIATGQETLTLTGHTDRVLDVTFSPDGKRLVSGSDDRIVKFWDSITGQELLTFKGNRGAVFNPDGTQLVVSEGSKASTSAATVIIRDATPRTADPNKLDLSEFHAKSSLTPVATTASPVKSPDAESRLKAAAREWKGWSKDAPAPAIAPFDAEQASQLQDSWAKHFVVPVEYTNSIGMKFRLIPTGEFLMGSTAEEIDAIIKRTTSRQESSIRSEGPQHRVILTQPIYLGIHEVTQREYEQLLGKNPSHFASTGGGKETVDGMDTANYPVDSASWNDAAEFCAKLSHQENFKPCYVRLGDGVAFLDGNGYRLPTEAEWEFACRAGTTTSYWFGGADEDLAQTGWFNANTDGRTHAVGSLKPNPFGLYDMHGNLWEWVQNWWDPNDYKQFEKKTAINPTGPSSPLVGFRRVLRGGSWAGFAPFCRSSFRHADAATLSHRNCGFRLTLPVDAVKTILARQKQTEGDKHRDQKDYPQAIACFREVIAHEPNNLRILNRMAWLMAISPAKDQPATEAVEIAQRASQRDPNDLNYRNTLGAAQCRAGQFVEALRNLGEIDKDAPPNFRWRTHNLLFQAICHQKLGDLPNAQAAYDKALELLKPAEGDTSLWLEEARLLQTEVETLLNPS